MTIQTSPKTITVYGDSYTAQTVAIPENVTFGTPASMGIGLGGTDATLVTCAAGGVSLNNAVMNQAPWTSIRAGSIQSTFSQDLSGYVVFRYGINDVLKHTQEFPPAYFNNDFSQQRAHLTGQFGANLDTAINAAKAAGRKVILYVPPVMPIATSGVAGWEWNAYSQSLMAESIKPTVLAKATQHGVRVIDQSGTSFTSAQMVDWIHANAPTMHTLSIDFGQKLRTAITGY